MYFFEEMASLTKWAEESLSTREYYTIDVSKLEVELDKVLRNLKTLGTDYTAEPRL